MLGIADYLWRLIPANPILLRVVESAGKRRRDLFIRCGYLGLLVLLVVFFLLSGGVDTADLTALARTSAALFQSMSYLQLGLVALLAPIFTAGAITQEKDSQTYDILLATPLTNAQIVLGSLLSRLFFVIALLISGIPIFSITQIFGGVAIDSIVRSFGIAVATAFVTGALAMAIAVFKVGTRRTIFSFYLFVVVYLVGLFVLDGIDYFHFTLADGTLSTTSWFTGLHPFLALRSIFHQKTYIAPELGDLPPNLQAWPVGWYLSNPSAFYITFMVFLSFVLVSPSILVLRRLAQSSTTLRGWLFQKLKLTKGDRTRKPRIVWNNPIAWREAKTKASAARASLLRYSFMACGLLGAAVALFMFASVKPPQYPDYIDTTSFNPSYNQFTVYSSQGSPVTLLLGGPNAETSFTLNGKESSLDKLRGRYSVVAQPAKRQDGTKVAWASIAAYSLDRRLSAPEARTALLGLSTVELAVILLIVTNAAASTVTREKEDGSLDLLLTTPITSRYYVWGKLRGLVSFVLPLVAIPVASVLMFVIYDFCRRLGTGSGEAFQWIVLPEAVLLLPGTLVITSAFAAILGMQMSLRCRKTVVAVMSSVGIVVGVCAGLGWCGYQLLQSRGGNWFGFIAGSFSPFTLLTLLIDPYSFASGTFGAGNFDDESSARWLISVFSFVAVGAYAAVVWSMYKSMVKNFDMTIRRQSR